MSKETVALFFEKVSEDEKLQNQMMKLSEEHEEEAVQRILALATEHGYPFTLAEWQAYEEELQASLVESGELAEEEMEAVAGGGYIFKAFAEQQRQQQRQQRQLRREAERAQIEHEISVQE